METKILLVEDYKSIRQVYKRVISKAGYYLKCARDGKEALRLLESELFHMIICDFILPDINGIDLIKQIKKRNKDIYSILTSSDEDAKRKALSSGIDDFILKPSQQNTLIKVIKYGIQKKMVCVEAENIIKIKI